MIRKRIEEVDEDGRRTVTVVEEPQDGRAATDDRVTTNGDMDVVEEHDAERFDHGPLAGVAAMFAMLAWWVGLAGVAVFALLATRLGFQLGEANATNNFVDFIYDITGPLVQPFQGISDPRTLDSGGIFYPETAIAMGVYLVATALVMLALNALAGMFVAADEGPVVHRERMVRGHGH
jgi:uncharacterized protein YggT (Ycf19 family)